MRALGFRASGLGFEALELEGLGLQDFGARVGDFGCRLQNVGLWFGGVTRTLLVPLIGDIWSLIVGT